MSVVILACRYYSSYQALKLERDDICIPQASGYYSSYQALKLLCSCNCFRAGASYYSSYQALKRVKKLPAYNDTAMLLFFLSGIETLFVPVSPAAAPGLLFFLSGIET